MPSSVLQRKAFLSSLSAEEGVNRSVCHLEVCSISTA